MFSGLRIRLTLLYLLATLALIGLNGAGAYWLLDAYFQRTTDLALAFRMAQEFRGAGLALPGPLAAANTAWLRSHAGPPPTQPSHEEDEDHHQAADTRYDGDLAAIYVLPLNRRGQLLASVDAAKPAVPDQAAVAAALAAGQDSRTITLASGARVRLLTYRVDDAAPASVLQLGRSLSDQDRVLRQLVLGLLILGASSAVLLAAVCWWLAGRTLRPTQAAWARQQQFVANASHELRAPLTLLRASAEVALRSLPAADTDRRELLNDVLHESDHMNQLVDDLLLLSRLDAGQLTFEHGSVDIATLIDGVRRQVGRVADERKVRLEGQGSGMAQADQMRLRQVLLIVLDNALRHTPPGGSISISGCVSNATAELRVSDTGSGIAPEHLPHVFERFYRGGAARGSDGHGNGLGLSIARALVEGQHGHIAIESQLARGTSVTITLPGVSAAHPVGAQADA